MRTQAESLEDFGSDSRGTGGMTTFRYRVLVSLGVLAVITYIHRVGFATATGEFPNSLKFKATQVGDLMTAFMIAYGLFEIPWGALGDKLGARSLLAMIALGGALTTAGAAAAGIFSTDTLLPYLFLLLLRFLNGAFQAGTFPVIARAIADWVPIAERGSAQGFIWMSSRVGGAVIPLILIPMFKEMGGWRLPLILVSLLGPIWIAAVIPRFRNRPEETPGVGKAELERILEGRAAKSSGERFHLPWKTLLRSRNVWMLCLMYGGIGYSANFYLTLLPLYLREYRHIEPDTAKWLSSLPFFFGIAACLIGGIASDKLVKITGSRKWGRRLVGATGLAGAAFTLLSTAFVENVALLAVLLCVTFVLNDLAMGPAWAAAADIGERYAGTLGGAMNMTASFTAALAAFVTGRLFDAGYVTLPFYLFFGWYVVGSLCWLGVDVTRPLAQEIGIKEDGLDEA